MPHYEIYVTVMLTIEADSQAEAESEAFLNWRDGEAIDIEMDAMY
jgi:hypothetical protein